MFDRSDVPRIGPADGGRLRPQWSVMIPTHNCASLLGEAIESVLVQDPGRELMQIEVVDDHSTGDDPGAVVQEFGDRVQFFRQPENVGHSANFNTCVARSRGHLVHVLHGDDMVRPGFYDKLGSALTEHPDVGAAFCRYLTIDESGNWEWVSRRPQPASGVLEDGLRAVAALQPIQMSGMVIRRSVYEALGGFVESIRYCGEDWEMWMRIAGRYPLWFESEPLTLYRVRERSLTGAAVSSAMNTKELARVIRIASERFPKEAGSDVVARARENAAMWALSLAGDLLQTGNRAGCRRQLVQAVRLSRTPRVLGRSAYLAACIGADRLGMRAARS